jgi:hypothetical protein
MYSPRQVSLMSAAVPTAVLLVFAVQEFLGSRNYPRPESLLDLLSVLAVEIFLGLIAYVVVRTGLFSAKCRELGALAALLIPLIFMSIAVVVSTTPLDPLLLLVAIFPSFREADPYSLLSLGFPIAFLYVVLFAVSYIVGRFSRGRAVVA